MPSNADRSTPTFAAVAKSLTTDFQGSGGGSGSCRDAEASGNDGSVSWNEGDTEPCGHMAASRPGNRYTSSISFRRSCACDAVSWPMTRFSSFHDASRTRAAGMCCGSRRKSLTISSPGLDHVRGEKERHHQQSENLPLQ